MALKQQYASEVVFIVADLDNPQTALFREDFDIYYIPDFYFINAEGVIVAREAGVFSFEEMAARIELIVGEQVAGNDDNAGGELTGFEKFFSETLPSVKGQRSFGVLALVFLAAAPSSLWARSPTLVSVTGLLLLVRAASGGVVRNKSNATSASAFGT